MIDKLKKYLDENEYGFVGDEQQRILIDEDRIQIYFRVDEDYCVFINEIYLADKDGDEIELTLNELIDLSNEIEPLLNEWVKPSDNTVVIEGRSYEI